MAQHNWSHITSVLQDMKLQCKLLDCSEELGMMSIQGPLRWVWGECRGPLLAP